MVTRSPSLFMRLPILRASFIVLPHSFACCTLPQVLRCIGSDGVEYSQLVKGKDDLRLDAVMQQLFGVVNQFLSLSAETAKRRLTLRTYKVGVSGGSGAGV
jgi:hypothetical protein